MSIEEQRREIDFLDEQNLPIKRESIDITAQPLLENLSFPGILDGLPYPLAIIGLDDRYENRAFECLDESAKQAVMEAVHKPVSDRQDGSLSILEAVIQEKRENKAEFQIDQGQWFEMVVSPVSGLNGERYAQVAIIDITERKTAEQRSDEATQAYVHDLRQPLTALVVSAQFAMRLLRQSQPDLGQVESTLGKVIDIGWHMNSEIGSLLDKLKLRLESSRETIVMGNFLELVVRERLDSMEVVGTTVEASLPPADLVIMGDRRQLALAVRCLIDNVVQAEGTKITISHQVIDGKLVVNFTDDGSGISTEIQEKIFQGHSTKPYGSGIGLPLVKRVARIHGGDVEITRSVTEEMLRADPELKHTGTTFAFSLPLG